MHGFSATPVHLPAWLAAALLAAALGLPPVLADEDAERAVAGIVHELEGLEPLSQGPSLPSSGFRYQTFSLLPISSGSNTHSWRTMMTG